MRKVIVSKKLVVTINIEQPLIYSLECDGFSMRCLEVSDDNIKRFYVEVLRRKMLSNDMAGINVKWDDDE